MDDDFFIMLVVAIALFCFSFIRAHHYISQGLVRCQYFKQQHHLAFLFVNQTLVLYNQHLHPYNLSIYAKHNTTLHFQHTAFHQTNNHLYVYDNHSLLQFDKEGKETNHIMLDEQNKLEQVIFHDDHNTHILVLEKGDVMVLDGRNVKIEEDMANQGVFLHQTAYGMAVLNQYEQAEIGNKIGANSTLLRVSQGIVDVNITNSSYNLILKENSSSEWWTAEQGVIYRQEESQFWFRKTDHSIQMYYIGNNQLIPILEFVAAEKNLLSFQVIQNILIINVNYMQANVTEFFKFNLLNLQYKEDIKKCYLCLDCRTEGLTSCQYRFYNSNITFFPIALLQILLFIALLIIHKRNSRGFCRACCLGIRRCCIWFFYQLRFCAKKVKYACKRIKKKAQANALGEEEECCLCYQPVQGEQYFPCGRHQVHLDCLHSYQQSMHQSGKPVACPLRD